ncbi:MAG: hypothetical protein FJ100_11535 [Deltaproteobacteria bacterium]|nr:hypothetical protein [Deltaproteobacteria bacterium]
MSDLPALRQLHAVVALLVVGSLALVPVLVPTHAQLGSHSLSDRDTAKARTHLRRADHGRGATRDLVVPLARLALDAGEFGAAAAMLRGLPPTDTATEVRTMVRAALRGAGRPGDLVADLDQARRRGEGAALRELAEVYDGIGLVEPLARTLAELAARDPGDVAVQLRLVAALRQLGDLDGALAALGRVWRLRPDVFTEGDFEQLLALSAARAPPSVALELAAAQRDRYAKGTSPQALARHFEAAGRLAHVRSLLDPLVADSSADDDDILRWARAAVATDHTRQAMATLRPRLAQSTVPGSVATLLCEAALGEGELQAAVQFAEQAQWRGIGGRVALWMASALVHAKDLVRARAAMGRTDDEALAGDPVTAVAVWLALGRRELAAMWAHTAEQTAQLSHAHQLWLVELDLQLDRNAQAAEVLSRTSLQRDRPGLALRVAALLVRAGAASRGLGFPGGWPDSAEGRAARALLLAAAGRGGEALALVDRPGLWLELTESLPADAPLDGKAWLYAMAQAASDHRHAELHIWALRQLLLVRPQPAGVPLALAQALLAAGHVPDALAAFQALPSSDAAAVRSGLLAAFRAGHDVRDELVRNCVAYLASADLRAAEPQSWLHLLLDLGARREALPFVAHLARTQRGAWAARHVELLASLGEHGQVAAEWRTRGADPALPAAERLEAAQQLMKSGDRGGALLVYLQVAASEGPDGATVKQILYLWGPRPGAVAIQWLVQRARTAVGPDRVGWLKHLLWAGAAEEVLVLAGSDAGEGPLLDLWMDAAAHARQHKAVAGLVERRADLLYQPATLRRLAEHCAAHGQRSAAETAYARLVHLDSQDGAALRWLAQAHHGKPAALRWWSAYFDLPAARQQPPAWQDRMAYGDLLLATADRKAEGRAQLQIALRLLDSDAEAVKTRDRERGRLLIRLGRQAEAVPSLERALLAAPCDDALRADLVALLMGLDLLDKAQQWVDVPASCNRAGGR